MKSPSSLTRFTVLVEDVLGMKYFVTMEPHDVAALDRLEIHESVLPPRAHCVLYCEHRSTLALPTHREGKSLILLIFCHLK